LNLSAIDWPFSPEAGFKRQGSIAGRPIGSILMPMLIALLTSLPAASQSPDAATPQAGGGDASKATKPSAPATAIAAIGPSIAAKSWLLYDVSSQQVLAAHEAQKTLDPASLTKLMTAYLSFAAIKEGRLKLDQRPPVSQKAWKAIGSRMFIDPAKPATVEELLKGMIVQSGNDASVILA